MALANWAAYLDAVQNPQQRLFVGRRTTVILQSPQIVSTWYGNPDFPGIQPSTAVALNSTSLGAIPGYINGTNLRLVGARTGQANTGSVFTPPGSTIVLIDRLSQNGGLSGNVTGTQTTNFPTAPLTRYTTGVGVWMAIEFYNDVGNTTANVTVSYTNENGVAGRTATTHFQGGSTAPRNASPRMLLLALQSGDLGVRSAESVSLDIATGTVGNYGITLFRPLVFLPFSVSPCMATSPGTILDGLIGLSTPILPDACLAGVGVGNMNCLMMLTLSLAEV